jgi:hypothetical protein
MCTEGLTTTGLKYSPVTPRARFCYGYHASSYSQPHTFMILRKFQGCTECQQEKSHISMQIAEDKLQFLITRILELREQGI